MTPEVRGNAGPVVESRRASLDATERTGSSAILVFLVGQDVSVGVPDNEPADTPVALLRRKQGEPLRMEFRVPRVQVCDRKMDGWTSPVDAVALGVIFRRVALGQDKFDRAPAEADASWLPRAAPAEEFGPAEAILVEGDGSVERTRLDEDVIEALGCHRTFGCEA